MADSETDHNAHAQSLAFLNEQARVSTFEFDKQEHVTQNPSDLQEVLEAQVVTTNKDSYKLQTEEPNELQSGPPKKYIDNPSDEAITTEPVALSNFAHNNLHGNTAENDTGFDAFVPSTDDKDKQNYESFFAEDNNNNNNNNNDNNDNKDEDEDEEDIKQEEQEQKQTFLSVWQEEHRKQLTIKGKQEREAQNKLIESGKNELDEFNEQRRIRIEQQRKDAKSREADLREDYNAVFKHGTIWQQVAKLVDLKTENEKLERMRDLLIVLKNQDEQKSDQ